jgi:hypothetical protein
MEQHFENPKVRLSQSLTFVKTPADRRISSLEQDLRPRISRFGSNSPF